MDFPHDPSCVECELHEDARHACVPTLHYNRILSGRAVVFIGQNPGRQEDRENEPLVGKSGKYVRDVLCASRFGETTPPLRSLADIFFTNTARCVGDDPKDKQYRTCSDLYLYPDLTQIRKSYDETVLLALGRPASAYVWKYLTGEKGPGSVAGYTKHNGQSFVRNTHFVGTYHPAAMLRDRSYHESIVNHTRIAIDILLKRRPGITKPDIIPPCFPEDL